MEFNDVKGNKIQFSENKDFGWRPAVYGFLKKDNKLLCIKPCWDDKLTLPGGSINLGEDLIEALKREFMEETGFQINILNNQPTFCQTSLFGDSKKNKYFQRISLYYEVELLSNNQVDYEEFNKETEELDWKDISKLTSSDFTHFQRDFLKLMLNK